MNTLFADGVRDALRGSKWLIFHCRNFSRSFRLCKKTLPIPVAILDSSASLFCNRNVKLKRNQKTIQFCFYLEFRIVRQRFVRINYILSIKLILPTHTQLGSRSTSVSFRPTASPLRIRIRIRRCRKVIPFDAWRISRSRAF